MHTVYLKNGREKSALNRHPWLFSGGIARVEGQPKAGDVVEVRSSYGDWLGRGYFNAHSQIRVRLLSWDEAEQIDDAFWHNRLKQAIDGRITLINNPHTDAFRLVFAESDRLPGLIVDRYGDYLVMQCLTAGIDQHKTVIVEQLVQLLSPAGILERSDSGVRKREGLPKVMATLYGDVPESLIVVHENGLKFQVDLRKGHKTGFYLDQRKNRQLVCQPQLVAGKSILNVFSYTGGFGVYAGAADAGKIINIDSGYPLLELAEQNIALNQLDRPQDTYLCGDAFQILRDFRQEQHQFDLIILDPPKFAHSQRDVQRACRGYKDLNLLSMGLLKSGGWLATFSCSGLVTTELFQKVLFGAAVDAGRHVQIRHQLHQAPCHPIALTFPESAYLKGFLCQVW